MKEIIDEKNNKIIGNINLDNSKVKFTGSNNILYINEKMFVTKKGWQAYYIMIYLTWI